MDKLRFWAFPATLLGGWIVVAAYAVSLLIGPMERTTPPPALAPAPPPAAVADSTF